MGALGSSTNTEITLAGQNAGVGIIDHAFVPTQGQGVLFRNNGEVDIGRSDTKFVDLYLSGGVKWTDGQVEINSGRLLQRSTGDASGLRFDGSGYTPFKNGSVADGTVDLGYSSGRYKDLYLSGGVYLGGTGSANKLEDYEEGTWTPSLGGNASYSIQSGQYTKIGRLVFVQGLLSVSTLGTGSTTTVSGLPFPANNVNSSNQGGSITYFASLAVNVITPTTYVPDNATSFSIQSRVSAGTTITSAAIFGNSARIDFSITYETDS